MKSYLLIDDDDIIQFVHRKVIERFDPDAAIHVAFSVDEALAHLLSLTESSMPDVIFLDINMPMRNGFDFLKDIRTRYRPVYNILRERTKVFLLTSSVNPRDMQSAEQCVLIERLLSKPLSTAVLEGLAAAHALTREEG